MTRMYYFIHADGQPNPTTPIFHVKVGESAKEQKNLQKIVLRLSLKPTSFYFAPFSVESDEFIYKLKTITGLTRGLMFTSSDLLGYLERINASANP